MSKREKRTFTVEQLEELVARLQEDDMADNINGRPLEEEGLTLQQLNLTIDAIEYLVDTIHQQRALGKKARLKQGFIIAAAKKLLAPDELEAIDREAERRVK